MTFSKFTKNTDHSSLISTDLGVSHIGPWGKDVNRPPVWSLLCFLKYILKIRKDYNSYCQASLIDHEPHDCSWHYPPPPSPPPTPTASSRHVIYVSMLGLYVLSLPMSVCSQPRYIGLHSCYVHRYYMGPLVINMTIHVTKDLEVIFTHYRHIPPPLYIHLDSMLLITLHLVR